MTVQNTGLNPIQIKAFSDIVYLLAEQEGNRVYNLFEKRMVVGTSLQIPRFGILQTHLVDSNQYSPVTFDQNNTDFRNLLMARYGVTVPVSQYDIDRIKVDPTAYVGKRIASAIARRQDDIAISAILGAAGTGEFNTSGASTTALPSSQLIAVNDWSYSPTSGSGNTTLSVGKLINARKKILAYRKKLGLATDNLVCIMAANQHAHLLQDDKFINAFYNKDKTLAGEPALNYLGMDFIISEEMSNFLDSNGNEQVIVMDKAALIVGVRGEQELLRIDRRPDLDGDVWQVKGLIDAGAVRMEEGLVVVISCLA